MPKALTIEEKRAKALGDVVSTPSGGKPEASKPSRRRNVFNGTEGKLKVSKQIPGYHLYIFNDEPGRIDSALESGYEFVHPDEIGHVGDNVVSRNTDITDKVRFLVGRSATGGPLYGYLMKIKQEWWDEDQAAIQDRNNKVDAAVKGGKAPGVNPEGFYVPEGGIKLTS